MMKLALKSRGSQPDIGLGERGWERPATFGKDQAVRHRELHEGVMLANMTGRTSTAKKCQGTTGGIKSTVGRKELNLRIGERKGGSERDLRCVIEETVSGLVLRKKGRPEKLIKRAGSEQRRADCWRMRETNKH